MKAVRLHKFHDAPVIDEVPEPTIAHPLDVTIGGSRIDANLKLTQWADQQSDPKIKELVHRYAAARANQ